MRLTGKGIVSSGTLKRTVVENDGLHAAIEKSGAIYLSAGEHPIRAEWFNGPDRYLFEVDYSGPGFTRRRIPSEGLFRTNGADETKRLNGLTYQCFEGRWDRLPDFGTLQPTATGTVENFDIPVSARKENVAMTFSVISWCRAVAFTLFGRPLMMAADCASANRHLTFSCWAQTRRFLHD